MNTLKLMRQNLKRNLGWVEAGLYLGGVALLAAFFLMRFEAERQREAGVAAFLEASSSSAASVQSRERQLLLTDGISGERHAETIPAPDVALWSEQRIRDYEESLAVEAEPPLAVMNIEKLDIRVPVYDGADEFNLTRGVARIAGTAAVGQTGNLGIAGHRDGFFRGLKDISIGDDIDLLTTTGNEAYTVSSIDIVDPADVWVLDSTQEKTITLVTCYPFYYVGHAPKRYIVKATAKHSLAKN